MGFLGESAPPASCLGVPIGAGTRSPPEFLGSRWPNPKREFLSFDIYNEGEVLWAVATRVQADQDVDIIKNANGNTLDPSQTDNIMTTKMIIDATRPVQRPFAVRVAVPKEAMDRVDLEDFIPRGVLERLPKV